MLSIDLSDEKQPSRSLHSYLDSIDEYKGTEVSLKLDAKNDVKLVIHKAVAKQLIKLELLAL